jgi:hypothetical protein
VGSKTSKNETLLPCPFCGGSPSEPWETEREHPNDRYLQWRIQCNQCSCRLQWCRSREEAVREWNQRQTVETTACRVGPDEPNNDMVICPQCTSQFTAIPVNVQSRLRLAHNALWGIAQDGWLCHGSEGMSAAQQRVYEYTQRYAEQLVEKSGYMGDPGSGTRW